MSCHLRDFTDDDVLMLHAAASDLRHVATHGGGVPQDALYAHADALLALASSSLAARPAEVPGPPHRTDVALVPVSREFLPALGEWSGPVQMRVVGEQDGELSMEFRLAASLSEVKDG